MNLLICALAIVVVCVEDSKGLIDQILRRKNGMHRTVGLYAALGRNEAAGKIVKFLESIMHLHTIGNQISVGKQGYWICIILIFSCIGKTITIGIAVGTVIAFARKRIQIVCRFPFVIKSIKI